MKTEDLMRLSTEELINIKEAISEIIKARDAEMEKRALSEVATVISKWNDKQFYFYVADIEDNKVPIYPKEIRVTRSWL